MTDEALKAACEQLFEEMLSDSPPDAVDRLLRFAKARQAEGVRMAFAEAKRRADGAHKASNRATRYGHEAASMCRQSDCETLDELAVWCEAQAAKLEET